ncbi:MAG: hypothetical protein ACOY3M_03980 [Patescibacteria group bacterium]
MPTQIDYRLAKKIFESTESAYTSLVPDYFFECRTTQSVEDSDSLYTSSAFVLEILRIREDFEKNPEAYPKADDKFWD